LILPVTAVTRKFDFHPKARLDVAEGYDWYEEREIGLGEDFLRCVQASLNQIRRNPESYQIVYRGCRRALVRRFPYSVIYRFTESTITIIAVFHNSQDQAKWRGRIQ
jgi:plasmid stabilization system protein ParE